jgi:hypothetical protein
MLYNSSTNVFLDWYTYVGFCGLNTPHPLTILGEPDLDPVEP